MTHFTLEDGLKLNSFLPMVPIGITPDGRWLAYNIQNREQYEGGGGNTAYSKTGVMIEMAFGTVWVTDTLTGEHRNLTPNWGSSWAPRWSPDGTRLAFFSDKSGTPHLFVWHRETDEMQAFTAATVRTFFGFEGPKWTPDGRFVLFTALSEEQASLSKETEQEAEPSLAESFVEVWDWPKKQFRAKSGEAMPDVPAPDENWLAQSVRDVVIADVKTGELTRLMTGNCVRSIEIAPDGKRVAVMVHLGNETRSSQQQVFDLYVLPVPAECAGFSPGTITPLACQIQLEYGITLSWSPNSRTIAYTTQGQLASGDASIVDVETGAVHNLTADFDVNLGQLYQPPLWTEDGETLLCLAEGNIWKVPLQNGPIVNLTEDFAFTVQDVLSLSDRYIPWTLDNAITIKAYDPDRNRHGFYRLQLADGTVTLLGEDEHRTLHADRFHADVASESGQFVYVAESNRQPQDIWLSEAAYESPRQVTMVNSHLKAITFGESQLIEWTTEAGKLVKGILLLPRQASETNPVPMIVNVYAGAICSHYINRFGLGQAVQTAHPELFVSHGYAVFLPDVPIEGLEPYRQIPSLVLPGIEAAVATGSVDAERVGVIGHSFGGYTVNVLITQTTRFKAAIAVASPSDLISGFLSSASTGWYESGQGGLGGTLWEYPQRYIDGSPVFHLDRVETPLLLIHGDQDFIPFEQPKEMFMGLARLGKEVVLVKYKEADHWPGFWSNDKLADYWERVLGWFNEYLVRRSP